MRVFASFVLATGLGSSLIAQGLATEHKFFSPWPEAGTPVFHRVQAGRLGADHLPDTVVTRVLDDSLPSTVWQPNTHRLNAAWPIGPAGSTDVAILPGVAPEGRDGLLSLTPSGLQLHWAVSGQTLTHIITWAAGGWDTVQRLWVIKQQNGQHCICALDGTGTLLLRLNFDGIGFVTQPPLFVPPGLTDVDSVDFDGAGEFEVVFWSDPFLFVVDWAGLFVGYLTTIFEPGDANPPVPYRRSFTVSRGVRDGNANHRDLIVVHYYRESTGGWWSFACNSTTSAFTSLGSIAANHQAVADLNGDGLKDIVLSCIGQAKMCVIWRTDDASLFSLNANSNVPLIVPGTEVDNVGIDCCVAGDFDGDGDDDLIAFQGPLARTHSVYGNVVSGRRVTLDTPPWVQDVPGHLDAHSDRPADWTAMAADPTPGTLHVQIEGWVQADTLTAPGRDRVIFHTTPATFSPTVDRIPISFDYAPDGLVEGEYVLQLQVSIVRIHNNAVTQRYPSRTIHCTPNRDHYGLMRSIAEGQAATFGLPSDGDGSVNGNKSTPPPDNPPEP